MRALSLNGADLAELSAGVLGRGGLVRFQAEAQGSCMVPVIRDGDMLTIEPVEAAVLRPGDVALYSAAGDHLFSHRVVGRRIEDGRLTLMTRGDAATGPGEPVRADQVLGRVVRVQRGGRTLDLERGTWRTAGRLWVATAPLGPLLLRGASLLLGAAGRVKRLAAPTNHRMRNA
jgi:hypothetical protein